MGAIHSPPEMPDASTTTTWITEQVVLRDTDFHALTVFRDPVAPVWSMYWYQTKTCYECDPLLDVYAAMNARTCKIRPVRASHLQNHMTTNCLSTNRKTSNYHNNDDENEEKVLEAIYNMQNCFPMIGWTEHLDTTMKLVQSIFPWLQETIEGRLVSPLAYYYLL